MEDIITVILEKIGINGSYAMITLQKLLKILKNKLVLSIHIYYFIEKQKLMEACLLFRYDLNKMFNFYTIFKINRVNTISLSLTI